jgi:HEAT repeat protein
VIEQEPYLPASSFLNSVANEEVVLDVSDFGKANLQLLIQLTRDADRSTRDWATMLLASYGPKIDQVRDALLAAAEDEDEIVRAEAIEGLVERDREKALALVKRELASESVSVPLLYAARELADQSLVPLLEPFAIPSDDAYIDGLVDDALKACRTD